MVRPVHDPIEGEAATFPDNLSAMAALIALPYLLPQFPEWGTWLYEQSVRKLGWSNPGARLNEFLPDPRVMSIGLMIAHELGDDVTEARLRDHVEEHCEPRTFGEENDRFGFFFGWGEPYPRGQQSALLMLPEVGGRGAWSRWSTDANLAKFAAPTVESVDFPSVGLSVVRNDLDRGELLLHTYAATPPHAGRATTMRVVQIPDVENVRVTCDGEEFTACRTTGADAIALDLPISQHQLAVRTGYHGGGADLSRQRAASTSAAATTTSIAVGDTAADHAHCSVGSYTRGFIPLEEAAKGADTTALIASGWVGETDIAGAAAVNTRPATITYQPLAVSDEADVVLIRLTARSLMALQGAWPELTVVTKPSARSSRSRWPARSP